MKIVITEVSNQDNFYDERHLIIGLIGEAGEIRTRDDGWSTLWIKPDKLCSELLGFTWPTRREDICFFAVKYRKGEDDI